MVAPMLEQYGVRLALTAIGVAPLVYWSTRWLNRASSVNGWLDRGDAENGIQESSAFRRRLYHDNKSLMVKELARLDDLPDGDRRIATSRVMDRHERELATKMRLEYTEAHHAGFMKDDDLYHEDTLQAWLLEIRDPPESERAFDPFLFLQPDDEARD